MLNATPEKSKTLQARILSGSFILLSGSSLATAINFAYNIAVARFLGPKGFGNATAVYTLLTILSAVVLSFQIISAKVVAQQGPLEQKYAGYRRFHGAAWACGIIAALVLLAFPRAIATYLNLPSRNLILLLAVGAAFYVPLGSRRGYLQGTYGFRRLAGNLVLEGAVRLGGSLILMVCGFGVPGVIAANSAAVAVAYLVIVPARSAWAPTPIRFFSALREMAQAGIFFTGQVLINNCDIVLVKHFFLPTEAGLYTAVAMVGRVIFVASSSVVNSMFPLVAGTREEERRGLKVIATSLLLVLGIGSLIALCLRLAPAALWTAFFGSQFIISGKYGLSYLLSLYAITTVIYSLSAVIITYEMSYKFAHRSWIQLAVSGLVVAGIVMFHSSLRQVILVQLVLMVALLLFVAIPFLVGAMAGEEAPETLPAFHPLRAIRPVSEDEVIASFLRSDFDNPAFCQYRESLGDIVLKPDLEDVGENIKRRALFLLRHLALWKEIPLGTEWCELEIGSADIGRIRVFPRAHWRRIAHGNLSIMEVAEQVCSRQEEVDSLFLSKVADISNSLMRGDSAVGPIVLIGIDESAPLTILDGNHRLLAAMLASPSQIHKLRFLCGLSPKMEECCWYNTNLATLFRYGRNVITHAARRPKSDLVRILQSAG